MASVTNFTFQNLTNLGNDNCTISQRTVQNNNYSSYMTANILSNCDMAKTMDVATSQPYMFPNGAPYTNGCDIYNNVDTQMRTGEYFTKFKTELDLNPRSYLTVPYLGNGPGNPELETKLQQGTIDSSRKTYTNMSEHSDINRTYTPMLSSLKSSVQDTNHLIEDDAAKGWIRSGIPTRFSKKPVKR